MKRYRFEVGSAFYGQPCVDAVEHSDGDYVLHAEAESKLADLRSLLRRCESWLEVAHQASEDEPDEYTLDDPEEIRELRMKVATEAHR
jgi:hypothetical protein